MFELNTINGITEKNMTFTATIKIIVYTNTCVTTCPIFYLLIFLYGVLCYMHGYFTYTNEDEQDYGGIIAVHD